MSVIFEWFLEKTKKKNGKIRPTKLEYKSCGKGLNQIIIIIKIKSARV